MGDSLPGVSGFGKQWEKRTYLPNFQMIRIVPAPFVDSKQALKMHNDAVKDAIKFALLDYWRTGFREHFKQAARYQFSHVDRASPYKKIKKKETSSITDIVRSGRTKTFMTHTQPKFKILTGAVAGIKRGGTTSSSRFGVTGAITLKFPFPTKTGGMEERWKRRDGKKKITPTELAKELEQWSSAAMAQAAACYIERYKVCLTDSFSRAPKIRERYEAAFEQFKRRY